MCVILTNGKFMLLVYFHCRDFIAKQAFTVVCDVLFMLHYASDGNSIHAFYLRKTSNTTLQK